MAAHRHRFILGFRISLLGIASSIAAATVWNNQAQASSVALQTSRSTDVAAAESYGVTSASGLVTVQ